MSDIEMISVKAKLIMELSVDCPECDTEINLFNERQNEEGELYRQVIRSEWWEINEEDRLKTYAICPHCSLEFDVKGVIW